MVFEIYDLTDYIINFISVSEYKNLAHINSSFNEIIKEKEKKYKKAVKIIEEIQNKRKINLEYYLTKKTLIRLYVRTYTDDMVKNIYNWSYPKIRFLLNDEQIQFLDNYINENPEFTRRNMKEYLSVLTMRQLEYMGY